MRSILRRAIDKTEGMHDAGHTRDAGVAPLLAAAAIICWVGLAAPAAAHVSVQPAAVNASALTPKRLLASGAAVTGLIGATVGGLAVARSAGRIRTGNGRRGALVALVLGPIAWSPVGSSSSPPKAVSAPATGWPAVPSP